MLPPAQEKLLQLAEALKKRPELRLQIQGRYDPITDANFLKKEKFEAILSTQLKQEKSTFGEKEVTLIRQKVLEQLYLEQFSIEALNKKRARYGLQPIEAGTPRTRAGPSAEVISPYLAVEAPPYRKALQEQLIEAQTVSERQFQQLGQARAVAIKKHLVKQGGIKEGRPETLQLEAVQTPGQEFIRCQLDLS